MSQRILFVGHSGHRSGAPIILLNFLRWLKANDGLQAEVMLLEGGPLVGEFAELAPTEVLHRPASLARRITRRLIGQHRVAAWQERVLVRRLEQQRFDLVYANTVVPQREMLASASAGLPVICHVHELSFAIQYWGGANGIAPLVAPVAHFIAASSAVRDELIERWRVPDSKVTVVHEFVTTAKPAVDATARLQVRSSIGVGDQDIVVGGCGTLDWRKGADLFLQIARLVGQDPRRRRKIHFVWLGAQRGSVDYREFVYDAERSGVTGDVTLLESTSRPTEVFAAMDIFALTSREDPFPLVMLEAAALRVPMICFADSGGGPEFASGGAGIAVPYLNVNEFADCVLDLAEDAGRRETIGATAAERVADRFTIDRQAPKLREVIRRFARGAE